MEKFQTLFQNPVPWLLTHGVKVVVILVVGLVVMRLGKVFISRIVKVLVRGSEGPDAERAKKEREKTLSGVFYSTFKVAVWAVAILTILPEFGINIGALLAGIGVVGLALGMGARNVIQDYLAGLFIIIEDQYRVGEEVKIASVQGKVLELNLRRTILQDEENVMHSIPNGKISVVSNLSRGK